MFKLGDSIYWEKGDKCLIHYFGLDSSKAGTWVEGLIIECEEDTEGFTRGTIRVEIDEYEEDENGELKTEKMNCSFLWNDAKEA